MSLGLRPIARSLRTIAQAARYGRPTGEVSTEEYARQYPDRWRPVVPPELPVRIPPQQLGPEAALFEPLGAIPELGVMEVPQGLVMGPHGWVFSSTGHLLVDCVWPYRATQPKVLPKAFPKPRHLRGTCLNIASDWTTTNYGHFMMDGLSRYRLFTMSGIDPQSIDYIYAPKADSDLTLQLMRRLGIPLEKCIWAQEEPCIRADVVLAPSFPGARHNYARWVVDFLRTARDTNGRGARRIYVPRGKARNISNEGEILDVLRDFDFEIYDFTRFAGFEFFADADIVVGPHGAGLTNIAFCKPGTTIIDIIPSDHVYTFFYTIAASGDLNYNYILGRSAERRTVKGGTSPFDFWVDPEVLRTALKGLTEEAIRSTSDTASELVKGL